jgi:hypothetical protein
MRRVKKGAPRTSSENVSITSAPAAPHTTSSSSSSARPPGG